MTDGSGDRKYFTIIPNYILNHSSIWDREIYIQMKKIAGEDGTCYTSQETLAKKCGISVNRLKKSLKYLIEHEWIYFIGVKETGTKGGFQGVNEYRIADLWRKNIEYYENKGVAGDDTPSVKGVSQNTSKGCHENAKGVSPEAYKEDPLNKIPLKKIEIRKNTPAEEAKLLFNGEDEFSSDILSWIIRKGVPKDIAGSELTKFVMYWTEPNKSGTKQRWELQKTFEIKRRLSTWFAKVQQFNFNRQGKKVHNIS